MKNIKFFLLTKPLNKDESVSNVELQKAVASAMMQSVADNSNDASTQENCQLMTDVFHRMIEYDDAVSKVNRFLPSFLKLKSSSEMLGDAVKNRLSEDK